MDSAHGTQYIKHICDFCGDTIEKGTKYNRDVFKDDYIFTWNSHFSCDELVKKMNMYEESNYEGVSEEFFRYFVCIINCIWEYFFE